MKVQPEYEDSSSKGGVGEDVEDAEAKEGEDVLHVVQVGAAHSLDILVHTGLVEKNIHSSFMNREFLLTLKPFFSCPTISSDEMKVPVPNLCLRNISCDGEVNYVCCGKASPGTSLYYISLSLGST